MKPSDLFDLLLSELEKDAQEYVQAHRKFYTTYASSIRMKHKSGKLSTSDLGFAMEYDGYKIERKYEIEDRSVWCCAQTGCQAGYIFDSSNELDEQLAEHNHLPPLPHELISNKLK